jgi:Family of unknown function (DUF6152)
LTLRSGGVHKVRADGRFIQIGGLPDVKTRVLIAAVLTSVVGLVQAHHSFATFDQTQEETLVGTIKEVQWTNPHIWVQVLVTSPSNAAAIEWSIEGGSPNALNRQGWKRSSLNVGDAVEIVIHPLKDGSNGGSLVRVSVNGKLVGTPRTEATGQ